MSREVPQPTNHRYARIQKRRSASLRRGRGLRRCRTSSCWRRQRLSAISNSLGRIAAAKAHSKQRNVDLSRMLSDKQEADVAQRRQGKGFPDYNFAPYRGVLTKQSVRVWLQKHEIGESERVPPQGRFSLPDTALQ